MRSRLLVVPTISILLAACQHPTPTGVPTALPTSPSLQPLSQVEILETQHVWDQATARAQRVTPTVPAAATESPSTPASTPDPDLLYTADDLLPSPYTGTLPDDAVAVLGLGSVSASPSPDARYFAISSVEGVMVYDFNTLQPLWDAPKPSGGIMWLSDGRRIQIGRTIWEIESSASLWESTFSRNLSPNGEIIAQDNGDNTVSLFDRESGKTISVLPRPDQIPEVAGYTDSWSIWISFSPDSRLVATTYRTGGVDVEKNFPLIAVWDVQSGKLLHIFEDAPVRWTDPIHWSPDGSRLASTGFDVNAIFDIQSGQKVFTGDGDIWWSPDGFRFFTMAAYSGANAGIWNAQTMQLEHQLDAEGDRAAWALDSARLITGNSYGIPEQTQANIWDVTSGLSIATLQNLVCDPCAFGINNAHILSNLYQGNSAVVWELRESEFTSSFAVIGTSAINDLAWSPDGTQIMSSSGYFDPGQSIIWNARTIESQKIWTTYGPGVDILPGSNEVEWSPDNSFIAWGGVIWKFEQPMPIRAAFDGSWGLAIDPHGQYVAGVTTEYQGRDILTTLNIWRNDGVLRLVPHLQRSKVYFLDLDWSPDGSHIAVAMLPQEGEWRYLDTRPPVEGSEVLIIEPETAGIAKWFGGVAGSIYSVAWSPDGSKIAAGFARDLVAVWDVESGKLLYKLTGGVPYDDEGTYVDLDWSADSKLLAAAYGKVPFARRCNGCGRTNPGAAVVWDVEKGERLYRFDWQQIEVQAVEFSLDGSLLASGGRNGTIVLWDMSHK